MDPEDFKKLGLGTHWWFKAKAKLICSFILKTDNVLEVGCGVSDIFSIIKSNLVGVDINKETVKLNQTLGMNCLVGNAKSLPFKEELFDVVVLSDIIEHVDDDVQVLKEAKRVLKVGGKIIVTVPAFKFLWTDHDVVLNHYRRYTKKSLLETINKSGLKCKKIGYWNLTSFFPKLIMVFLEKVFNKKVDSVRKSKIDFLFSFFINVENKFIKQYYIPFGVSVVAVLEK